MLIIRNIVSKTRLLKKIKNFAVTQDVREILWMDMYDDDVKGLDDSFYDETF